ncbi:class I SAM-dependent methyltransferase [Hoeflea ulvae]|uniref:Class I SAM-dependent methyltransferase n=1 Tax=Hoeflea ulvae TaxID=2983764 RepID=A0ABT3YCL9_9HYPH|nr:class I SAM-dependent methyltransferase [Hoeflea ulvae]MCY0093619.1 class I SAM-dependent methyltransferase [Hoeflea ulvae]
MHPHWTVTSDCVEIARMPFYWRLSGSTEASPKIDQTLPIRVSIDHEFDYLRYQPTRLEWDTINRAYRMNENIGFLNPESGQMDTYGSSVNRFFLGEVERFSPRTAYEIGCGAGFSIAYLKANGFRAVGIDPSEYSRKWSQKLGFELINEYFGQGLIDSPTEFIYCNDVFEHIPDVVGFSEQVFASLCDGGVFCFSTTNSTQSIELGDISQFEHQHVNMFTSRSIHLILLHAGFSEIEVRGGSYGNTFHVTARKLAGRNRGVAAIEPPICDGYLDRAARAISAFQTWYDGTENKNCYVPLRSLPYLAAAGDFGRTPIFDTNTSWTGKFIDGYQLPILSLDAVPKDHGASFFVGSMTFFDEIRTSLIERGVDVGNIVSIRDLLN